MVPFNQRWLRVPLWSVPIGLVATQGCDCASRTAATRGTCPLRHASRPSMARSVADVVSAHGLRGQVPHIPANCEASNNGGFDQQESTKLSGDMGGIRPETLRDRTSRMSVHGCTRSASLGVHPPCRRGSDSTSANQKFTTNRRRYPLLRLRIMAWIDSVRPYRATSPG
jgi:hypothetical protein